MKHYILSLLSVAFLSASVYAQNCTLPKITATSGGTYCPGDTQVTLEITGELGDATDWQWYTGSCGGDIILTGENATSITVAIGDADSYFVRGIGIGDGNCVGIPATCTEIEVVLDNLPPEIVDCPADESVKAAEGKCEAVVIYKEPVATDNCDGDITVIRTEGLGSGASFPVGSTTETYEFIDSNGNISTCSFTITVKDEEPPVITCPADIEEKNDEGKCGAEVTYKLPTVMDNCSESKDITISLVDKTLESGAFFSVGTTKVEYVAIDEQGNKAICSFNITVLDVEPPVITLSKDKTSKWPPNHKPFKIEIADYIKSIEDNCDVSMDDLIIDEVSSDEEQNGSGDGNTEDDIVISDDCKTVYLLAERQGGGNGRVYTVNLAVPDIHGNIGYASIKAVVKHDNGKNSTVIDDGPLYIVNGCDLEEDDDAEIQPIEESTNGKTAIEAIQTYPNPANKSLKVKLIAEYDDKVSIDLYNLSGKKILHLYKGDLKQNHGYSWDFDIEHIHDRIFLLVVEGEKMHRLRKILKDE